MHLHKGPEKIFIQKIGPGGIQPYSLSVNRRMLNRCAITSDTLGVSVEFEYTRIEAFQGKAPWGSTKTGRDKSSLEDCKTKPELGN